MSSPLSSETHPPYESTTSLDSSTHSNSAFEASAWPPLVTPPYEIPSVYPIPRYEPPSEARMVYPIPFSGVPLPEQTPFSSAPPPDSADFPGVGHVRAFRLYKAAIRGDWKEADMLISSQPELVRTAINSGGETALHLAVGSKQKAFIKKLVKHMNKEDLALKSFFGSTALNIVAASGDLDIAKVLVHLNEELLHIQDQAGKTPIEIAASLGHRKMVLYLYGKTNLDALGDSAITEIFHSLISAGFYDMALNALRRYPPLARSRGKNEETALNLMARMPYAIACESETGLFKILINFCFDGIFRDAMMRTFALQLVETLVQPQVPEFPDSDDYNAIQERLPGPLFEAAALGNAEFLIILIRSYPNILFTTDDKNRSLFHIAALNRFESIFTLIYEIGGIKDVLVEYKEADTNNNMLHLVASMPPPDPTVSGAALQMQRELLWFKAVKELVPPSYVTMKNNNGELPRDVFNKNHQQLRAEGEKWMKDTASSCMLVATLIVTVVFAAAFTIPGGTDDSTGTPILHRQTWFSIFTISDSLALVSSSTSILTFLSILTSRYAEQDFLLWLPMKLMIGLSLLFVSIVTMMLAFVASVLLIYGSKFTRIPIFITSLAFVAATSFGLLQGRLWIHTIRSTYSSKFPFDARRRRLYR